MTSAWLKVRVKDMVIRHESVQRRQNLGGTLLIKTNIHSTVAALEPDFGRTRTHAPLIFMCGARDLSLKAFFISSGDPNINSTRSFLGSELSG
eukprot:CAMPEP_0169374696 /NCGR_PEP_ID=MMETSP1017-20121227/37693_1 /TAXON_ID=342587 /ORGANISM="Karlodinium micrum, Strain CCMP2283" /LENGTH=92 /DNA_ID=CAMNT_0009473527 /DNA_START=11 /DNA_END=289 /DNA_ORIENTATION=+